MKALACKDFGIKCNYVAKGDTSKEVINNASEHVKRNHPKSWPKIEKMSEKEMEQKLIPKIKEIK